MSFLYFLEGLRCPALDAFFSIVTMLGEETLFIVIGLLFFWCIDKYEGYFILSVGFIGTVLNQFLKIVCRIPRPWVRDKGFTIVESAREQATGYSFPSGHTQSAVGSFGSIARYNKNRAVRIVCTVLCVLIPLSRMYLGVHTPADVLVSLAIALALIFGIYPIIKKCTERPALMWALIGAMAVLSAAFLLFVSLYRFPQDIDKDNLDSAVKNAYTLAGCVAGMAVTYFADSRFSHFETRAPLWGQAVKLIVGVALVFAVKEGLKAPLAAIFGGHQIATLIRYFILVVVAGTLWPLTFRLYNKKP